MAVDTSMKLSGLPKRIFIDATYTIGSGRNSGIERVVRNVLSECERMGTAGRIPKPQLVVSHGGKFYAAGEQHVADFRKTAAMQANVLSVTPRVYRRIATRVCQATGSAYLKKWFLPQAGHLGVFKLPHVLLESGIRHRLARQGKPIVANQDDLFLLPDAYWINRLRNSVWPAAAQARRQGAVVSTVIYDLIPLTHPEFVGLKRRDAFLDYFKKAARHSDLLVAISETVRKQVTEHLERLAEPEDCFCRQIRSFELGAELDNVTGSVCSDVRELFQGESVPYVMVATLDPRKNHKYLLDAFDLLWKRQKDVSLCLIGRVGSRCDDIMRRISQHPQLGKKLSLFDQLSDAELHYCYRRARGVIFPSIVEGFGLPIVESLWFGKKTFASDTKIHREVGQEDCSYFSLSCPTSLANQILDWEDLLQARSAPPLPTRVPTTWRESSQQVMAHCLQLIRERNEQNQLRSVA